MRFSEALGPLISAIAFLQPATDNYEIPSKIIVSRAGLDMLGFDL